MVGIYKITNKLNNKCYIGQSIDIKIRWLQHIYEGKRNNPQGKLYSAIFQEGINNFSFEVIEECPLDEKILNEKERYWIEYYHSFENGYNSTKGGDGKIYLDYDLIYNTWLQGYSISETAKRVGCHEDSVVRILQNLNISKEERWQHAIKSMSKPVCKIDKDTDKIIEIYPSVKEAERANNYSKNHISPVCQGKKTLAFGYKWKFLKDMPV